MCSGVNPKSSSLPPVESPEEGKGEATFMPLGNTSNRVWAWLEYWKSCLADRAVKSLQDILGSETPSAQADSKGSRTDAALRELLGKWRARGHEPWDSRYITAWESCADELEEVLSASSQAPKVTSSSSAPSVSGEAEAVARKAAKEIERVAKTLRSTHGGIIREPQAYGIILAALRAAANPLGTKDDALLQDVEEFMRYVPIIHDHACSTWTGSIPTRPCNCGAKERQAKRDALRGRVRAALSQVPATVEAEKGEG